MNRKHIEHIQESFINGQREQMVNQINRYGQFRFWSDYMKYLDETHSEEYSFIEVKHIALVFKLFMQDKHR